MDHSFEIRQGFNCFVESIFLSDVLDDAEIEFGGWDVRVRVFDLGGFPLGADGGYYGVAVLEEDV
jgi:hypothetical protein